MTLSLAGLRRLGECFHRAGSAAGRNRSLWTRQAAASGGNGGPFNSTTFPSGSGT